MPRNEFLTDADRIKIQTYKKCGVFNRQIAKIIHRSKKDVRNFLKLGLKYGIKIETKRKHKYFITADYCKIRLEASKNHLFSAEIVDELQLSIKMRSESKNLTTFEEIVYMKPRKEPTIKVEHQIERLGFAKKY
jgi:transposase